MGNKVVKIVKGKAKEFNKKRKYLKPPGITCILLVKDGEEDTYTDLEPEVKNFYYDYDGYKEATKFMVATLTEEFKANLLIASDVRLGDDIYEINKRDITAPDGDRGFWRFYAKMSTELY